MKPRVIVTRRWPAAVEKVLAERFDAAFNPNDVALAPEGIRRRLAGTTMRSCRPSATGCPLRISRSDGRTKLIANFGVGFSHIDIGAARERDIVVTNTPGVLTDCTADLAMSLMLSVARRTGEGERQLRAGEWTGWCPTHMIGAKVSGKTLGIIGMGRIGKAMAKRAHYGFDMKMIFFNRSRVEDAEREGDGRGPVPFSRRRARTGRLRVASLSGRRREPAPDRRALASPP